MVGQMIYEQLQAAKISSPLFDLRHTFESGCPLTFHGDYDRNTNSLIYTADGRMVNVGQPGEGKTLMVVSSDVKFATHEVARRFRLADDLNKIYKRISTDDHINDAINKYKGMRVTLNDPWETTLCFIISQFNNVKRIRLIVKNLIDAYGSEIPAADGKGVLKSFPRPENLIAANAKDLMKCGTGFRAKYIQHAAEYCTNNLDLYKLNPGKYEALKETLMEINGVGDKVADCIALMGYGNLNAFPIDVHIKRSMENLYFKGKKMKMGKIHDLADDRWGNFQGYANQYLFHKERMS